MMASRSSFEAGLTMRQLGRHLRNQRRRGLPLAVEASSLESGRNIAQYLFHVFLARGDQIFVDGKRAKENSFLISSVVIWDILCRISNI